LEWIIRNPEKNEKNEQKKENEEIGGVFVLHSLYSTTVIASFFIVHNTAIYPNHLTENETV